MLASPLAAVRPLPASIECLPRQILAADGFAALLPAGIRVYLTDIGTSGTHMDMLAAARRLRDAGCIPVPHLAARRIPSRDILEARLGDLTQDAGVRDVLVVGGGAVPAGPFACTMNLLETGLLYRFGIRDLAMAGHPDFAQPSALTVLKQKQAFGECTGARLRIVTQFGFDAARLMAWVDDLDRIGIDVPVHIGVAGPARLATLVRYATLCGVESTLAMLKSRAGTVMSLAAGYAPDSFVLPIEQALAAVPRPAIAQMHVFPFGGLKKASSWLRNRGSWS